MGKLQDSVIGGAWFKEYPSFELNGQKVTTMALLRRRVDTQPTLFEPAALHLKTLKDFILTRGKYRFVTGEVNPKNWVDFVEKGITWAAQTGNDTGSSVFGIKLPSTEIALDAYPLLGLQDLWYEYGMDGTGQGHATFHIADPVMAESTIVALQTAAIGGGQIIQFWVPFLTAEPGGSKWVANGDLVAGEILEVSVQDWPFTIEVKFGSIPGQADGTDDKQQVYQGTAREVLQDMAKQIGVKIIWLPYPIGPTQLEVPLYIDLAGRPIRDTLVAYLKLLGMEFRWFRSPGGGLSTFLIAWDAKHEHEPFSTFFSEAPNQESKDFYNFLQQIADFSTTYFETPRKVLGDAGVYIDGIYNVLIPYHMDPQDAQWLVSRYEKSKHGKIMSVVQNFMARDRLPGDRGQFETLDALAHALAAVNDSIFTSHARFNMGLIRNIGSYRFRQPNAEALQQIQEAYPGGVTDVRQMDAASAAKVVKAKKTADGKFVFTMPTGGSFATGPNDPVYVAYSQSEGVGGARVFPSGATFPGVGNPEGGSPAIYPFEVSFDLVPYLGVWPGLPTYIAGFPPLDGGWEFYKVRYELNDRTQRLTAFLRTARLPLYIE